MDDWECSRRDALSAAGAALGGAACCVPALADAETDDAGGQDSESSDRAGGTPTGEWLTVEGEMFSVAYREGYADDAETIAGHLRYARDVVDDVYPHTLAESFVLRLYPADEYSRSATSMYYDHEVREIRMMTPSDNEYYAADSDWYRKNVVHEYVHVPQTDGLFDTDPGERPGVPRWFVEGFAEYVAVYETTDSIREMYHTRPQSQETLAQIEDGDGHLMSVTDDVYSGAMHVFRYFADEYSVAQVGDVFAAEVTNFTAALREGLDIDPHVMQKEWLVWAEANVGGEYRVIPPTDDDRLAAGIVDSEGYVDYAGLSRAHSYFVSNTELE